MTLTIIIETGDGDFTGRIEGKGNFMPATIAGSIPQLEENMRLLITDYQVHEGAADRAWAGVNTEKVEFSHRYDMGSFLKMPR